MMAAAAAAISTTVVATVGMPRPPDPTRGEAKRRKKGAEEGAAVPIIATTRNILRRRTTLTKPRCHLLARQAIPIIPGHPTPLLFHRITAAVGEGEDGGMIIGIVAAAQGSVLHRSIKTTS